MTKRILALMLALVLCLGLLAACDDGTVTADEAASIALKDAGLKQSQADVHTHVGEHDGKPCFEIHVESSKGDYTYYIDAQTGEILVKAEGVHE